MSVHGCPRCELRFTNRAEVEDHLQNDHRGAVSYPGHARDEVPAAPPMTPGETAPTAETATVEVVAMLDPKRPASPAVEVASRLTTRIEGCLGLLSVVESEGASGLVDEALAAEATRHPEVPVRMYRLDGPVAEGVTTEAAVVGADLLVLDSHGRGALGGMLLGALSAEVVAASPVPTLLVGPECHLDRTIERLVVAWDGSDDAEGALRVAESLAEEFGLDLEVVEVVDPAQIPQDDERVEIADLTRLARQRKADGHPLASWDVLHGEEAAGALIDYVSGDDVALVVGSHGTTATRGVRTLGGTAAATVRRSSVPVLVVSPKAAGTT